jgi:ribosome maturation factor RimP
MALSDLNDQKLASIHSLIHKDVDEKGFELVDMQFNRAKGRYLLRIFIDHENGIKIDDCEKVSKKISTSLDETDLIPGPYILEVSSPGLDRLLKKREDFERLQGHWIKLVFADSNQKTQSLDGKIFSCDDDTLILENKKEEKHNIPLASIIKAKLSLEF